MNDTVQRPQTGPREIGIQIEALLIDWAIPYEYDEAFPVDSVRKVRGTQVRDESHQYDRETAENYAAFMREDITFPPIIIFGEDVLIDGNTRVAAAKLAKRPTLPAFKCKFQNADLAVAFAGTINQKGGRRLTTDEAHKVAVTLIHAGYTDESITASVGYSRTHVNNWRREHEARRRAERTKMTEELERLNKSTIRKVAGVKMDAPFAAVTKMAAEIQPSAKQLTAVVKEINEAPSEADALEVVNRARSEMVPAGPPPHRPTMSIELRAAKRTVPQLVKLHGHATTLLCPGDDEWVAQWRTIRQLADEVIAAHA